MFRNDGHPNVTLSDWQAFRQHFPTYLFKEVLDRDEVGLCDFTMPLARGVAIPSDCLLRRVGLGSRRPRSWLESCKRDVFSGWPKSDADCKFLKISLCGNRGLWIIERFGGRSRENLVFLFGSTLILTHDHQSAKQLAEYCHDNDPPSGLRWVADSPKDLQAAIKFARQRRSNESAAIHNK
jgi:hypothetical protein